LAAAVAWSFAAAAFAAAMAALPSGLAAEFPGEVADATVALQLTGTQDEHDGGVDGEHVRL
jgi:hypothetical protein